MSKYQQLIEKIQAQTENSNLNLEFTSAEWELLEEALITIQFLEIIFAVRERNLEKDHE